MSFAYGFGLPHWQPLSGAFSPFSLFVGGVQGAWYDPSDFGPSGTLFQDSAGTTPVTAVEQAVGLMLDKSKGLVLGPELVGSPYTGASSGTWAIGATSVTRNASTGGQANLLLSTAISIATWYEVKFTVADLSGDTFYFRPGGAGTTYRVTANGSYTFRVPGGGTGQTLVFAPWAGGAGEVTITNISVRELPGNHAYQSINTSRPTLRARYNLLTQTENLTNAVWFTTAAFTSVTGNQADPFGGTKAFQLVGANKNIYQPCSTTNGANYTFRVYVRGDSNGTATLVNANGGSSTSINVTTAWTLYTVTFNAVGTNDGPGIVTSGTLSTIYVAFPDFRVSAIGSALPTYQRVGAATDYATAGFPPYLFFDGVDDSLLTNSVDFATVTSDGQARRNLLLNPTQFDAEGWTKNAPPYPIVTANTDLAPDGTMTMDTLAGEAGQTRYLQQIVSVSASTTYAVSIYIKSGTSTRSVLRVYNSGLTTILAGLNIDWTGTVPAVGTTSGTWVTGPTITVADNGTYRVVGAFSSGANTSVAYLFYPDNSFTGSGTVKAWGAQFETGSTATAFQNIGTDKMLVVAGVTKQSDAAAAILAELSATAFTNNGAFAMSAPGGALNSFFFRSRGTAVSDTEATFAAPTTKVVTGIADIGADTNVLRVNGTQAATSATDQGTGNYGNYPLYIGRRNNATLPFNGSLFSLIIAGQSYAAGQVTSTEQWVAAKTPLGTI